MLYRTVYVVLMIVHVLASSATEAKGKSDLITGVNLRELIAKSIGSDVSLLSRTVRKRGVFCILIKGKKQIGSVQLGVYADRQSALDAFKEHLRFTSVGPDRNLGKSVGEKAVGWSGKRILLMRDNVVVNVGLPPRLLLRAAKAIDQALVKGTGGVQRGHKIHVPRITKAEAPKKIREGTVVDIRIHVVVSEGANGDGLGCVDAMGAPASYVPLMDPKGNVEVIRTVRYHAPRRVDKPMKVTFWVCYATSGCIMTSKEVTLKVTKK